MSNLLDCPFCGGDAYDCDTKEGFVVVCEDCGAQTNQYFSKDEATDAWNARVDHGT